MLQLSEQKVIHSTLASLVEGHPKTLKLVEFEDGSKLRFFTCPRGNLCVFAKGSNTKGFHLSPQDIKSQIKKVYHVVDNGTKQWRKVDKLRRYASKAVHTNPYIEKCLALPETRDAWEQAGSLSLDDYKVAECSSRGAEAITVDSAEHSFPGLREAIESQVAYNMHADFRGYQSTIELKKNTDGNTYQGWLSLNYVGAAHGHVYLLINNECFCYYGRS